MRVIFDNNVLLSAAFFKDSTPDSAFEKARKEGIILRSYSTSKELNRVIHRAKFDKYFRFKDRTAFVRKFIEASELVFVNHSVKICRDPKDNMYLELALSGQGDCIVSGDKDLLVLHPFNNIPIISASDFLERY